MGVQQVFMVKVQRAAGIGRPVVSYCVWPMYRGFSVAIKGVERAVAITNKDGRLWKMM